MFNLLVKGISWPENIATMERNRILQAPYTIDSLAAYFAPEGQVNFDELIDLPALFAEETDRDGGPQQLARVGKIHRCHAVTNTSIEIEYSFDPAIPAIPQSDLIEMAPALGIVPPSNTAWGDLHTGHWAVKRNDLYRELYLRTKQTPRRPQIFTLPEPRRIDPNQLSVMMPFDARFNAVYDAIERVATQAGMNCNRADNIWGHAVLIQDIVALIDRSAIVICDCTERNANVFYEIGIAHSLGKEVVLITQQGADIPFDIAHLRHIRYLSNGEGIQALERDLSVPIQAVRNRN